MISLISQFNTPQSQLNCA